MTVQPPALDGPRSRAHAGDRDPATLGNGRRRTPSYCEHVSAKPKDAFSCRPPLRPHARHRTRTLRRALPLAITAALAVSAPALAAPSWTQPFDIAGSDTNIYGDMVVAPDGTTVALWGRMQPGDTSHLEASVKPPGGVFGPPVELAKGNSIGVPRLAVDATGTVSAVWTQGMGDAPVVRAARRPAGGLFSAPQTISDAGAMSDQVEVAAAGSTALITWRQADRIRAAVATGSGAFEMQNPVSVPGQKGDYPQPAVAPSGAAVVAWRRYDTGGFTLRAAARKPGEPFAPLADVLNTTLKTSVPHGIHIVMSPGGRATMAWQFGAKQPSGLSKWRLQWATRGTSGDFGPVGDLYGPTDRADADFGLAVSAEDTAAIAIPSADGVRTGTRPSGSGFSALQKIPGSGSSRDADIAFTTGDKAIAMWHQYAVGAPSRVMVAERPQDAPFGSAHQLNGNVKVIEHSHRSGLGTDDEGSGMAWFVRDANPTNPDAFPQWRMQAVPYDAVAPAFVRVSVPATARVGQTIAIGRPGARPLDGRDRDVGLRRRRHREGREPRLRLRKGRHLHGQDHGHRRRRQHPDDHPDRAGRRRARAAHLTCPRPALPRFGGSEPGRARQRCQRSPINGSG